MAKLLSTVVASFYISISKCRKIPVCPYPYEYMIFFMFLVVILNEHKIFSHGGFCSHLALANDVEYLFICLLTIYIFSLEKISTEIIEVLCLYFNWAVGPLWWNCKNSSYILILDHYQI